MRESGKIRKNLSEAQKFEILEKQWKKLRKN